LTPDGALSEVKLVTVGVSDLARSQRFYAEAFGYVERGAGALAGAAAERAFGMPAGMRGRFVVMGPREAKGGLLRLVQWDRSGERIWGRYERIQDLGHYALNFRVREIHAAWDRLLAAGALPKAPPKFWEVDAKSGAWDSQCFDPDGVVLDVFEVRGAIVQTLGEQEAEASELQTIADHVSDAPRTASFYRGLGYEVLYDTTISNMEAFFGLPPGTRMRNINLMRAALSRNARVELAQYIGVPARPLTERALPPNLGILSASFAARSLEAAGVALESAGAHARGEPVELDAPPFGHVRTQAFLGLDGEWLEVFERRRA